MPSRDRLLGSSLALSALLCAAAPAAGQSFAISQRYNHSSTLLPNGNILVCGGSDAAGTALNTCELVILPRDEVVATGPLGAARSSFTATLLPNGKVLAVGGINGAPIAAPEIYDPAAGTWSSIAAGALTARHGHTATLLDTGRVLIAGGFDASQPLNDSFIFNPADNTFAATANSMSIRRGAHAATLLYNGRVLVSGGVTTAANGDFAVTTEIFDPPTGQWTPGPTLTAKRAYHTATAMGNRNVLILGGYNARNLKENQGILETAEIYNPVSGTISPVASMELRKMMHTATLKPDGRVSVFGGLGNFTTAYVIAPVLAFNEGEGTLVNTDIGSLSVSPINPAGTDLEVRLNMDLAAGVNGGNAAKASGYIVDGEIRFSSPMVTLQDAIVRFANPGLTAPLDGLQVDEGRLIDQDVTLSFAANTSTTTFLPQPGKTPTNTVRTATVLGGGSLVFSPDPMTCETTPDTDLTNTSTLELGTVQIPVPNTNIGGTVLRGRARLVSGSVSRPNSANNSYDATFDGGTANFGTSAGIAASVGADPNSGEGLLTISGLRFTGVTGTIACTSTTLDSPRAVDSGLEATSLAMDLEYVISPLNLEGQTLVVDITTIVVRQMVFSDQENYEPGENRWVRGNPYGLAASRFNHSSVLTPAADEFLLGGRTCDTFVSCASFTTSPFPGPLPYIYIFEAGQGQSSPWQATQGMVEARSRHTATVLPHGKVLVAGGQRGGTTLSASELYDPSDREFESTGPLRQSRSLHTATLLTDGTVLVAGGFHTGSSTGEVNTAELYVPAAGRWSFTGPMVSSRSYHAAVLLPDGNVLVTGGFANNTYLNSAEIYISTANRWIQVPMNPARAQHTAALLQDGRVLIAGGVNNVSGVLNSAQIFNPATLSFTTVAGMHTQRHSHASTLLRDGRVLVSGGNDGFGEIGRAEIYDPVANNWTCTESLTPGTCIAPFKGNNMLFGRQNHQAVQLPNGKVLVTGGVTALGTPLRAAEGFDVDQSSWQIQGEMVTPRAFHASIVTADGRVLNIGGQEGVDDLDEADDSYFAPFPDTLTPGPSIRQPDILFMDTATFLNNGRDVTFVGSRHRGLTRASGGGPGSADSSFHHPRLYIKRLDTTGTNSAAGAGFLVDLSSRIYDRTSNANAWSLIDSSFTVLMPASAGLLPFGWYHARVAANAQFSDGQPFQVGPARPTCTPGRPVGQFLGASSVTWTWPADGCAGLCPDGAGGGSCAGYHVYSAVDGVFLGTAAATSFIQTGLGPDSVASIKIAAYNISGDGPVVVTTSPMNTPSSIITGLQAALRTTTSIRWSWTPLNPAFTYKVFNPATGNQIGTAGAGATFEQTGLSTNTAYGLAVQAVTPGGDGVLSSPTTAFTAAAAPVPGSPPLKDITSTGWTAQWVAIDNPPGTEYLVRHTSQFDSTVVSNTVTGSSFTFASGTPDTRYTVEVAALNGDGILTSFTAPNSTATRANPPANLRVVYVLPSELGIAWDRNGNQSFTRFQVLVSSDNFVTAVSTPISFADNYTSTQAVLTSLLTGVTYHILVSARNQDPFNQESSAAGVQGFTDNGGGPAGSISGLVRAGQGLALSGTIGSGRTVSLRVPSGSFQVDTRLFISSRPAGAIPACGPIDAAITVTAIPDNQPLHPLELSISYTPGEPGITDLNRLAMGRHDPASNTCVPLLRTGLRNNTLFAQTNHLSDFQLVQLAPAGNLTTARVFPNPLYTYSQGYFTFDRLPAGARIRVYTLLGQEVFESAANPSGLMTWNATNQVGRPVASGVYIAVIEHDGDKKLMKLAVVR